MIKQFVFGGCRMESISANAGLAILRVYAGLSMALAHGIGKIPPSEKMIAGTGSLGFPMPEFFSWAAGLSEFGGGLLLAVGLFTRPSAFFIFCTMFVAGFIRHAGDPFGNREKALLFLVIALAFILIGGGKYGVDAWLRSRKPSA